MRPPEEEQHMNLTKTMKSDIRRKLVEKRFPSAEYEKLRAAIRQGLEADGPAKWKEAQMLASKAHQVHRQTVQNLH